MKKHPAVTVAANTDPTKRGVTVAAAVSTVRGVERQRFIVSWPEGGKRHRKWFTTRDQADRFAEQARLDHTLEEQRQAILQRRVGEADAGKLSAENLRDAVAALALLAGRGTLAEAAAALVRDIEARRRDVPTVAALAASYQSASEAAGLRPRSLGDLRTRLARFVEAFGPRKVNMVSSADARAWLEGLRTRDGKPLAPLSLQHFRFAVSGLFGYAIEHGHIEANPIAAVSHSRRARGSNRMESTAEILTPGEAKALLAAALEHAPAMVAPLALGLFAGVRTAELARMTWNDTSTLPRDLSASPGISPRSGAYATLKCPPCCGPGWPWRRHSRGRSRRRATAACWCLPGARRGWRAGRTTASGTRSRPTTLRPTATPGPPA
ncbi:MAG: hypothetical protein GX595_10640 [Lentisphaerae bacterium]|nr:hypothetical protein [Lentisphaerota bacterium]